ncbi:MAG: hypothetical protein KC731_33850 [Myxococcales bacterium]|nr:hypothetical protein [Myxococcales bacterium]
MTVAPADNPFERYGIDPAAGPEAITERLRERMEDAEAAGDDEQVAELREAWEALTLSPQRRLRHAIEAFPARPPLPPVPPRPLPSQADRALTLEDLLWLPSIAGALAAEPVTLPPALPALDDDPILEDVP